MSKFGKSDSTNDKIIKQQKKSAIQNRYDEKNLKSRLNYGQDTLDAVYEGGTVGPYDKWKRAGKTGKGMPKYKKTSAGREKSYEGIGDDFYEGFTNAITDYYNPQVNDQLRTATSNDLYDLTRRGLNKSSEAADREALRDKELAMARTGIANNAAGQTNDLRGQVNASRDSAMGTLMATEDPTLAANAARREVNAIQGSTPTFSPLADAFSALALGYGNYADAQRQKKYAGYIPSSSPYSGSGKNYG